MLRRRIGRKYKSVTATVNALEIGNLDKRPRLIVVLNHESENSEKFKRESLKFLTSKMNAERVKLYKIHRQPG